MAKDRVLEITGEIGSWGYSMGYVKYMMKELGEGPITAKITSYGGDVNHALKIKNLFETHGDVTVEYVGFNASASTLLGHGAKETGIQEDGLYLIHKPMVWVDAWGSMNEDELTDAIADLQAQKKDAETITLILAQDYVNSRGMELSKVMELMKESRWLSAKEAVELGLVDKIIPSKNKKTIVTNQAVAMMTAIGLPIPGQTSNVDIENSSVLETIKEEFSNIKKHFSFNNSKNQMDKQYQFINQVLNREGVVVKDDKVTLIVSEVVTLNNKLKEQDEALAAANSAKGLAETAKTTAENSLKEVLDKLDTIDETVKNATEANAKVEGIKTKLANRAGVPAENPKGESGKNDVKDDGADWETINNLAHNKVADEYEY